MVYYYQMSGKSDWAPVASREEARKAGAKKITILGVSEEIDEHTNQTSLSYDGPLYFDIDCKDDLGLAITSAKELVAKLIGKKVTKENIQVFCSGSKGMHVMVNQACMYRAKSVRMLPWVYAAVASELSVFGMDFQVYSSMKGNCWKEVNVKRDDGSYRVQITHEELESLTAESYFRMVSAPRPTTDFPPANRVNAAIGLASLFSEAKKVAAKRIKDREDIPVLAGDALKALKEKIPKCVKMLADGKLRARINYNKAAFQLGVYIATSGVNQGEANKLCSTLASKSGSSQYPSEAARYRHALGVTSYARGLGYNFSCPAIRSVLKGNPCSGCSVNGVSKEMGNDAVAGITETDEGFFSMSADGAMRQLTTFTLEILEHHLPVEGEDSRREGVTARVKSRHLNCKGIADIYIPEDGWHGKGNLIKYLGGLGALAVFCGDVEIQRIKNYLFTKYPEADADIINDTGKMGIHTHTVAGSSIRVYVEPTGSINSLMVRNTHKLSKSVTSPPRLLLTELPEEAGGMSEALEALTRINQPHHIGVILGWAVACHYKSQIMGVGEGFPSLNLWGGAGAGKNQTAERILLINGVDYGDQYADVMNVAAATRWPLIARASGSTTVPVIFDEFNEPRMSLRSAAEANEVVKSSWGGQSIPRGGISKKPGEGVVTLDIDITSPLVVLSEHALEMPAVKHRSIQLQLSKKERNTEACYKAYEHVVSHKIELLQVGKLLMMDALESDNVEVLNLLVDNLQYMPKDLEDRPKWSYQIALTGLDLLHKVAKKVEFDPSCMAAIKGIKHSVISNMKKTAMELVRDKAKSVVDETLTDMAMLVDASAAGAIGPGVQPAEDRVHYATGNGKLAIDYMTIYPPYLSWV
ncbi:MAG: hypothetical protein DRP42_06600, partial [Tenericutes bacterium]